MFLWNPPAPDRDGSLDAEIAMHELTHGVTNRMLGNAAGLNWQQGGGMGEGWSDFFSLSLAAASAGDNPDSQFPFGAYVTYRLGGMTSNYLYGIRRFPYSTVNTINPLTWADTDETTDSMTGGITASPLNFQNGGASEVHNAGEIWALTLWEVRSRVIAANAGNIPARIVTMADQVSVRAKPTRGIRNRLNSRRWRNSPRSRFSLTLDPVFPSFVVSVPDGSWPVFPGVPAASSF